MILDIPIEFIKRHLTGWVLIGFILLISYFIILRRYHTKKEYFTNKNTKSKKEYFTSPITKKNDNLTKPNDNPIEIAPVYTAPMDIQIPSNVNIMNLNEINIFDKLKNKSNCLDNYVKIVDILFLELDKVANAKQLEIILKHAVDDILECVKKNNITRTAVRNNIIKTLLHMIAKSVNNINSDLINKMNELVKMDSTTIIYTIQLEDIEKLRKKLEKYEELDKLLGGVGINVLDTPILPIYERNFDKIRQILNSDYNDNEHEMVNKYSKRYTEAINTSTKQEITLEPLEILNNLEHGIISLLEGTTPSHDKSTTQSYDTETNNKSTTQPYATDTNKLDNKDAIDMKLRDKNTNKLDTKTDKNTNKLDNQQHEKNEKNKEGFQNDKDLINNLLSGNFIQYILDNVSEIMNKMYNYVGVDVADSVLEDNMMPAGFILFVLSMLLYFVDITS